MDRRLKSTLTAMNHFGVFTMVSAFTTVAAGLIGLSAISVAKADEVMTPWGEPDLQGIWTDEFDAPLTTFRQICEPGILYRDPA